MIMGDQELSIREENGFLNKVLAIHRVTLSKITDDFNAVQERDALKYTVRFLFKYGVA